MKRRLPWFVGLLAIALMVLPGCLLSRRDVTFDDDLEHCESVATQIEYPCLREPCDEATLIEREPRTIADPEPEYWDLSLQEAVHLALANSQVLRDLGGTVLRSPETVQTPYGPAIQESDPQFGVESALSAFDAEFSTSAFFEKNDQRLNNRFLGNLGIFRQDYDVVQAQLTKQAATGSRFTLRKNWEFDKNNNLGNEFPGGSWTVYMDAEARHPLLRGGGLKFNRIAGPGGSPGFINGVLVARVKTDISLAEFEMGLRDFVSNVENAYWDLFFAYRDLHAKIRARDETLETWRRIHALNLAGRKGGEDWKELQAREQYFRINAEVQEALTGRLQEGTRTNNGSSPGTFRGPPGVYVNERKLRLLMGLPPSGERLIRPSEEPPVSPVAFQWGEITREALVRRAELRRQRWQVKRRELELIASRNFLLPSLDLVGRYRWRGFGETLIDSSGNPNFAPGDDDDTLSAKRYDNAYTNLMDGDFQEWQLGVEFSMPIGFRQGHTAVQNAELRLAQAKAVLCEQERQVVNNLTGAVSELDRAYEVMQTNYNRLKAANDAVPRMKQALENEQVSVFEVLAAQRLRAEAESRYYQSEVEYALALRGVHFEKGSLLAYCGIVLSEGTWPTKAYCDADQRDRLRGRPRPINYTINNPPIVSQGPYLQTGALPAPREALPAPQQPLSTPQQPRSTRREPLPAPPEAPPGPPEAPPAALE